jgi:hypothetical protein
LHHRKMGCTMLGKKLEELMENQPEVEPWVDITSKEDGDEESLQPQVGKEGRILVRKGGAKKEILASQRGGASLALQGSHECMGLRGVQHPKWTWLIDFDSKRSHGRLADYLLSQRWQCCQLPQTIPDLPRDPLRVFRSGTSLRVRDPQGGLRAREARDNISGPGGFSCLCAWPSSG